MNRMGLGTADTVILARHNAKQSVIRAAMTLGIRVMVAICFSSFAIGADAPIRPANQSNKEGRSVSPTHKGNNGLGNGVDPQPPGKPPVNDGAGSSPGHPGRKR